jgi:hypothetical protein
MTTTPARPKTVWQLAKETGLPLEVVIFQSVYYDAWQPGGVIGAEWADSLSSILHSSTPWRRPGGSAEIALARAPIAIESEPATAFAKRVQRALGTSVPIGDPEVADAAVRADLGVRDGDMFTGHADEAATWDQLAKGDLAFDQLELGAR